MLLQYSFYWDNPLNGNEVPENWRWERSFLLLMRKFNKIQWCLTRTLQRRAFVKSSALIYMEIKIPFWLGVFPSLTHKESKWNFHFGGGRVVGGGRHNKIVGLSWTSFGEPHFGSMNCVSKSYIVMTFEVLM